MEATKIICPILRCPRNSDGLCSDTEIELIEDLMTGMPICDFTRFINHSSNQKMIKEDEE